MVKASVNAKRLQGLVKKSRTWAKQDLIMRCKGSFDSLFLHTLKIRAVSVCVYVFYI